MSDVVGLPELPQIDDDEMRARLARIRSYSLVLLRHGPNYERSDARGIIWEHGRRNMQLQDAGILSVVLPVRGDNDLAGIGVFGRSRDETTAIMNGDPAIAAGVLTAEVYEASGFPGDTLPS
jgi:hypothetical protein